MRQTAPASMSCHVNARNKRTILPAISTRHFLSLSSSYPPTTVYNHLSHIHIMSFEVTATIANFGGKLLKLAHQVNMPAGLAITAFAKS